MKDKERTSAYTREMERARKALSGAPGSRQTAYWIGYRCGLQRAQYGDGFCTGLTHRRRLAFIESKNPQLAAMSRGYRDGLKALGWEEDEEGKR